MQRKALWTVMLAAVAAFAAAAHAEDTTEQELARVKALDQVRLQHARELATSGKPRDLYAAALLAPLQYGWPARKIGGDTEVTDWMLRAIQIGSDDPLIATMAAYECLAQENCSIDKAVDTLQRERADDVGTQLLLMRLAEHGNDAEAAASAWQRAVAASRYVDQTSEMLKVLEPATRNLPVVIDTDAGRWGTPANAARNQRVALAFALAGMNASTTQLKPLQTQCRSDALQQAVRRDECRRLFHTLANSPSPLMVSYATAWLSIHSEPQERAGWVQRKQQLAWTIESAGNLGNTEMAASSPKVDIAEYVGWVVADGELPAMRRMMAAHGVSEHPPAGWKPYAPPQ